MACIEFSIYNINLTVSAKYQLAEKLILFNFECILDKITIVLKWKTNKGIKKDELSRISYSLVKDPLVRHSLIETKKLKIVRFIGNETLAEPFKDEVSLFIPLDENYKGVDFLLYLLDTVKQKKRCLLYK